MSSHTKVAVYHVVMKQRDGLKTEAWFREWEELCDWLYSKKASPTTQREVTITATQIEFDE